MLDRLSRSWRLFKASAAVLSQDKELLLFPLVSLGALTLLVLSFAAPAVGLVFMGALQPNASGTMTAATYGLAFLFYFSQYFVIFFFNAALVGAAMMRLEGGSPTFRDGLRIASSRIGAIAGYAAVATTVGLILRAIQERVGFVGRIVVGLLGVGWTIATYLVVPVLVVRDVGPIDAVKESALLIKKTWGENVIGQAGLGAVFSLIFLGVALVIAAFLTQSVAVIVASLVVVVLMLGATGLVHSALSGIYSAALYRYATQGEGTAGFDASALRVAFAPK